MYYYYEDDQDWYYDDDEETEKDPNKVRELNSLLQRQALEIKQLEEQIEGKLKAKDANEVKDDEDNDEDDEEEDVEDDDEDDEEEDVEDDDEEMEQDPNKVRELNALLQEQASEIKKLEEQIEGKLKAKDAN